MRKSKILVFSLYVLFLSVSGISQNSVGKKYQEDFHVLITRLKELHPILYTNISKEEFDQEVKTISDRLLQTSCNFKAIYIIQELVYKIGNSHAGNLSVYEDLGVRKALPFSVFILNNELYINDYPADSTFNGSKIEKIENTESKILIDSLRIFFPIDGERDVLNYSMQSLFNNLYGAFCVQKDTFSIVTSRGPLIAPALFRGDELFESLVLKNNEE